MVNTVQKIKVFSSDKEKIRAAEQAKVNTSCGAAIYADYDIEISNSSKHHSLANSYRFEISDLIEMSTRVIIYDMI